MTSPSPVTTGTEDIPLAKVQKGFSELLGVLATVSTLLVTLFGHDFGIANSITQITAAGPVLIPIGLFISRAIKHHGIAQANALVIAQQVARGAYDITTAGKHQAPLGSAPTPTSAPTAGVGLDVGADLPVRDLSAVTG